MLLGSSFCIIISFKQKLELRTTVLKPTKTGHMDTGQSEDATSHEKLRHDTVGKTTTIELSVHS